MEFLKKTNDNFNSLEINRISSKFDLNKDIVKLLFAREINTDDKIERYLGSGISQLNNPFLLKNMQEVVEKIKYYVDNNKNILIYIKS